MIVPLGGLTTEEVRRYTFDFHGLGEGMSFEEYCGCGLYEPENHVAIGETRVDGARCAFWYDGETKRWYPYRPDDPFYWNEPENDGSKAAHDFACSDPTEPQAG